jgi:hypothetical protein
MRKRKKINWVATGQAAISLNISAKHLMVLRRSGVLIKGVDWRQIGTPQARRATYQYHLSNCSARLNKL